MGSSGCIPRWHDVGTILLQHSNRFPKWFQAQMDRISDISKELREERELSFYGDEYQDIPPEQLYTQEDAQTALENVRFILKNVQRLIEGLEPNEYNSPKDKDNSR